MAARIYQFNQTCKTQINGFAARGFSDCTFCAALYQGRKVLNGIEHADVGNFSTLMRNYCKTENPDKIRITFHGYNKSGVRTELYASTFLLNENAVGTEDDPAKNPIAGLGEAEVLAMVDRKVSEIERLREIERMRTEIETITRDREDLKLKNEELTARVEAQSTIETYANIAGKAAPILSAIFGAHPLVATATSLLAGAANGSETDGAANADNENKATIIRLIHEFLNDLSETELADLYSIMARMQADKQIIPTIAHSFKTPEHG